MNPDETQHILNTILPNSSFETPKVAILLNMGKKDSQNTVWPL